MTEIPTNTKFDAQLVTTTHVHLRIGDDLHKLSYEQARALFKTLGTALLTEMRQSDMTPILMTVSREFGLPHEIILSKDRRENTARARQTAMYLARELTNLSLEQIGTYFGDRDHGTALHAYRTITGLIDSYPSWKNQINRLKLELQTASPNLVKDDAPLALLPRK